MAAETHSETEHPLVSNATLFKITAAIGVLAILMALISIFGRRLGEDLVLAGHTTSAAIQNITVGQDRLALPANMIRFEHQRHSGPAETVNIYLTWPDLAGYSAKRAAIFSNPGNSNGLIFAELSQSVMSRDMSGRLEPIYRHLFSGPARNGPAGLSIHALDPKSGFGDEVILTAPQPDGSTYVVRCLLPKEIASASSSDCQRDIHVGRDMTLLYRFSSARLSDWAALDAAMRNFARAHLVE